MFTRSLLILWDNYYRIHPGGTEGEVIQLHTRDETTYILTYTCQTDLVFKEGPELCVRDPYTRGPPSSVWVGKSHTDSSEYTDKFF